MMRTLILAAVLSCAPAWGQSEWVDKPIVFSDDMPTYLAEGPTMPLLRLKRPLDVESHFWAELKQHEYLGPVPSRYWETTDPPPSIVLKAETQDIYGTTAQTKTVEKKPSKSARVLRTVAKGGVVTNFLCGLTGLIWNIGSFAGAWGR